MWQGNRIHPHRENQSQPASLLFKAEPVNSTGLLVIMYLRKGKKCCMPVMGWRVKMCEQKSPADTNVSAGVGGVSPGTRTEINLQPMQTVWRCLSNHNPWTGTERGYPHWSLVREDVKAPWVNLILRRREGWGQSGFTFVYICFSFSYSIFNWQLIFPSQVYFTPDGN